MILGQVHLIIITVGQAYPMVMTMAMYLSRGWWSDTDKIGLENNFNSLCKVAQPLNRVAQPLNKVAQGGTAI